MPLQLTIGCDPELFVRERSTGRFVSAHDLLPGTKAVPHKVPEGAVQVDGTAAEFNVDPCSDMTSFSTRISTVLNSLQDLIGDKYELVSVPTVEYPGDYFSRLPTNVRELGCDPDFNAWTGRVNERPARKDDLAFVCSGGGHVHVGWTKNEDPSDPDHRDECAIVARQLDYYLGMYSLIWDKDTKRRGLYGKAGAFRTKPYGVEYRSLSNLWVRSSQLQTWVYNAAYRAVVDLVEGRRVERELGKLAPKFINDSIQWWTPEAAAESADQKKVYKTLHSLTNLSMPPALPTSDVVVRATVKDKPKRVVVSKSPIGHVATNLVFSDGTQKLVPNNMVAEYEA